MAEHLDRLRTMTDDLPVLMCTVKVRDADRARAAYVSFLPKPFGVEQLTGAVRHLLADAPASALETTKKTKESPR